MTAAVVSLMGVCHHSHISYGTTGFQQGLVLLSSVQIHTI